MPVSDPLLKKLKELILELHSEGTSDVVDDAHRCTRELCSTLEQILFKGIKYTTSVFGVKKRDFWTWVSSLEKQNNGTRVPAVLSLAINDVKKSAKTTTSRGRGRLVIRHALQKKVLSKCVEFFTKHSEKESWYEPEVSVLGNEILSEILMSLLLLLNEINFSLDLQNASFLDETWELPIYLSHEIVPCVALGIHVQTFDSRLFIVRIEEGGVADDEGVLEVGDVVDEVLHKEARSLTLAQVTTKLRHNRGAPVHLGVVKCKLADGTLFAPVVRLLERAGRDIHSLRRVVEEAEEQRARAQEEREAQKRGALPPHALLPEDQLEQVPVHNDDGRALYNLKYLGHMDVGEFGGVQQIEHVVLKVFEDSQPELNVQSLRNVTLELGETQVVVTDAATSQELLRNSYTEISSCGRRVDKMLYFAYIIGETTCTLAKQFRAHVFRANSDTECRTILCAIAQGFDRTHWFV